MPEQFREGFSSLGEGSLLGHLPKSICDPSLRAQQKRILDLLFLD